VSLVCCFFAPVGAQAGLFKVDFAILGGEAENWDAIESLAVDDVVDLTDRLGGDDDVTLTVLDDGFSPNNPAPPATGAVYDTVDVPLEALADYLFKTTDTAGTSARMRFDNLDPGVYNITVFEGRQTDSSEFAVIWVGNDGGSNEPPEQNTGDYAKGHATVTVTVEEGDTLWYRHLEDNSGGISGMIIRPVIDVTPGDFNLDGAIDLADFQILADNFITGSSFSEGDMNFDSVVDLADFVGFVKVFDAQGGAAVPEPATGFLALLAAAFLALGRGYRRG